MIEATRELFPLMDPRDEGRIIPYAFGPCKKVVPIGILVGPVEILSEDINETSTVIRCSNPDVFVRFADSGKIQIDKERISYTGKNLAALEFTGVTRGVDTTEKAKHEFKAQVYQVLPTFKYIICENPRLVHFTRSIDTKYLDGRKMSDTAKPTVTVKLDDRDVIAGHSFVTITVDLTTIPPNEIRQPLPAAAPRIVPESGGGYVPPVMPQPTYYGSSGGGGGSTAGFGNAFFTFGGVVATGGSHGAPTMSSVTRYRTIREYPAPVIGQLEVDVTGLQDDSLGTLTGSAGTLLDRPAWIVRCLLREAWGELDDTKYNLTSFSATHTLQVADGLRWALLFDGQEFMSWRNQVLLEGKAFLFQWAGKWYYVYRRRQVPVYTFTPRETVGKQQPIFEFSPRTDLTTELFVQHGKNESLRRFVLRSRRGIARYGLQRNRQLNLQWIYEDAPAKLLGRYWLSQWDLLRLMVTIPTVWEAFALEGWDVFLVNVALMQAWGYQQLGFNLTDLSLNPDGTSFSVSGIEADPPGRTYSGKVRVQAKHGLAFNGKVRVGVRRPVRVNYELIAGGRQPVEWGDAFALHVGGQQAPQIGWDTEADFWDSGQNAWDA